MTTNQTIDGVPRELLERIREKLSQSDYTWLTNDPEEELRALLDAPPRCPACGYTEQDCREQMDHYLCGFPEPAPANKSATPPQGDIETLRAALRTEVEAGDSWKREALEFREKLEGQPQGEPVAFTAVGVLRDDGDGGLVPEWILEGGTAELWAGAMLLIADEDQELCAEDGHCELYRAPPEQPAAVAVVPEGYCIMPRRLTAENGAKALLLGEFKLETTQECPECRELDEPTEGCEICDGEGEYGQQYTISWDQIKFIYSKAVSGLAVKAESAKSR